MYRAMILAVAIFAIMMACARSDNDDVQKAIDEAASKLNLGNSSEIDVEKIKDTFKSKCIKNSNEEAFAKAEKAGTNVQDCLKSLFDPEHIREEIDANRGNGSLDEVFARYCKKTPQLKDCIKVFMDDVEPCFEEKERKHRQTIMNMTDKLMDFVCYRDGDRIALFIAEGGPECLEDKSDDIQHCINTTLSKHSNTDEFSFETLSELTMKAEDCDEFDNLQDCIVTKLEGCKEPTPANIAESLFKFVRKVTPCGKTPRAAKQKDSNGSAVMTSFFPSLLLITGAVILM